MTESPIFIVGCPRSGTSLLRDLLRSHPHVTFPGQSHFIPIFYRGYGDPHNEREARRLAARILQLPRIQAWGLALDPTVFAGDRSYRDVLNRLYGEWAHAEAKPRWGDKTPQYVMDIPTLLQLFPAAKIIHVYRDGRDVALSWLRAQFGPRNLFTAAKMWKRFGTTGHRVGECLPPKTYLEIRYESFVAHPEGTMRDVCAFIGEPFDEAVLTPSRLPRKWRPPSWIAEKEIVKTNVGKWKRQMSPADRTLFESVAGDLLESLGYEIEGRVRHVSATEQLLWMVHHRLHWLLYRLRTKGISPAGFLQMQWAALRFRLKIRS